MVADVETMKCVSMVVQKRDEIAEQTGTYSTDGLGEKGRSATAQLFKDRLSLFTAVAAVHAVRRVIGRGHVDFFTLVGRRKDSLQRSGDAREGNSGHGSLFSLLCFCLCVGNRFEGLMVLCETIVIETDDVVVV